jgi:hypothetical protein
MPSPYPDAAGPAVSFMPWETTKDGGSEPVKVPLFHCEHNIARLVDRPQLVERVANNRVKYWDPALGEAL